MKAPHATNRGQALVIFVFALIGLFGITGLAVDGGMIFSDRRNAQNAADTAALAGSIAKIEGQKEHGWTNAQCTTAASGCNNAIVLAALDRASSNGFTGNITDSTVEVHIPPISGPYSDCADSSFRCQDYVQVIIRTNVNTFFARVLGIFQMHNEVEAVALARYQPASALYGGNALVELKPGDPHCNNNGDFLLGGNSTVGLHGGGIWVNSDDACAALKEVSNCITLDPADVPISLVGHYESNSCGKPRNITQVTEQYPFPPENLLPEPAQCRMSGFPLPYQDGHGYWHYQGGFYSSNFFPPQRNAILEPGIYCVQNVLKTTNNYDLSGTDVLIWIKDGGYFSLQGGAMDLTGRTDPDDPYYGYLLYVDSDYSPSWGIASCSINGGANDQFTGAIYAPDCNVTINGGGMPEGYHSQIIGYTLKISGDAVLDFIYDDDLMPDIPEQRDTGLYR